MPARAVEKDILTATSWADRVDADRASADRLLPERLRVLHAAVMSRARQAGARGLILSGSTARGRRTDISDLDYHVIGKEIRTRDLSAEVDIHVLSAERMMDEIFKGDDFIQWSIRFGLVLFDDGAILNAARLIAAERSWPDVERKREHAKKSLDLARRVVDSGDRDGALIQTRTALSLAARAYLLSVKEFPLSRAELPAQLKAACHVEVADALEDCIYGEPTLARLGKAIAVGCELLDLCTVESTDAFSDRSRR